MDLHDRWVHFKVRDVYYPDPSEVLMELHGDDLLQGRVVDLTTGQSRDGAFLVVEVSDMEQPLIVPVKRILGVL